MQNMEYTFNFKGRIFSCPIFNLNAVGWHVATGLTNP